LPSGPQKRVVSRTITLPPELWARILERAAERTQGNVSALIAHDLQAYYGAPDGLEEAAIRRIEQRILEMLERLGQ
jgi:hypothetical protein